MLVENRKEPSMSSRNGDKSRFGRERRAKIARRLKKAEFRKKVAAKKG
jgi:hypothetical protein